MTSALDVGDPNDAMESQAEARKQDLFRNDVNLQRLLKRSLGTDYARWKSDLAEFGAWVGDVVDRAAAYTDRQAPPYLETYDAQGRTANRVRAQSGLDRRLARGL